MVHWLSKTEILVRIFVSVQVSHKKRITLALITLHMRLNRCWVEVHYGTDLRRDHFGTRNHEMTNALVLKSVSTTLRYDRGRFSLTWANRFIYWKMAAKVGNWYQTLGGWVWRNEKRIGLEHSVRKKQDYLFRCSIALGNFPLEPRLRVVPIFPQG